MPRATVGEIAYCPMPSTTSRQRSHRLTGHGRNLGNGSTSARTTRDSRTTIGHTFNFARQPSCRQITTYVVPAIGLQTFLPVSLNITSANIFLGETAHNHNSGANVSSPRYYSLQIRYPLMTPPVHN